MTGKQPTLFLFPNVLCQEGEHQLAFPPRVDIAVSQIDGLIAESEREAYRFLRRFSFPLPKTFRDIPVSLLNEHTPDHQIEDLLTPLLKGQQWGLISDGGMPCLADPGSNLVLKARQKGIGIQTFPGPSSLFLALVLSGLSGQRFAFHGYLPKEEEQLRRAIQRIQKNSFEEKSTQLFIEAPYRNQKLFSTLLHVLKNSTWLCVATDLTAIEQEVKVKSVEEWKKGEPPQIDKRPTVFLMLAKEG